MCVLRNYTTLKLCIELVEVAWFDQAMIKVGRRPMVLHAALSPEAKNKPLLAFPAEQIHISHTLKTGILLNKANVVLCINEIIFTFNRSIWAGSFSTNCCSTAEGAVLAQIWGLSLVCQLVTISG